MHNILRIKALNRPTSINYCLSKETEYQNQIAALAQLKLRKE